MIEPYPDLRDTLRLLLWQVRGMFLVDAGAGCAMLAIC